MPATVEQKSGAPKKSSTRVLRAGTRLSKNSEKVQSAALVSKTGNKGPKALFENRLLLMSSLRKNFTP